MKKLILIFVSLFACTGVFCMNTKNGSFPNLPPTLPDSFVTQTDFQSYKVLTNKKIQQLLGCTSSAADLVEDNKKAIAKINQTIEKLETEIKSNEALAAKKTQLVMLIQKIKQLQEQLKQKPNMNVIETAEKTRVTLALRIGRIESNLAARDKLRTTAEVDTEINTLKQAVNKLAGDYRTEINEKHKAIDTSQQKFAKDIAEKLKNKSTEFMQNLGFSKRQTHTIGTLLAMYFGFKFVSSVGAYKLLYYLGNFQKFEQLTFKIGNGLKTAMFLYATYRSFFLPQGNVKENDADEKKSN